MARRGPKGDSPDQKKAKGETRPSRKGNVITFAYESVEDWPDPDVIEPPVWMDELSREIWYEKVDRYRKRGQTIDGFEHALAQYVALEAKIIFSYQHGIPAPVAMINAHRIWAAEFYDTPASRKISPSGSKAKTNRFAGRGKRNDS
jgi:hypothetical protein